VTGLAAQVDNDVRLDVLLADTLVSLLDDLDVVVHSGTRHGGSCAVVTLGGCPPLELPVRNWGGRRISPSLLFFFDPLGVVGIENGLMMWL
jgi:hypothetical protein